MAYRRLYQGAHCTWNCQYHIVWTPKYRGKVLSNPFIKQTLKRIFSQIAKWKGFVIHQWHVGDEHIHLFISLPPSYSIAYAIGILKGKSSTWLKKRTKKFPTGTLWGRGYFVTTVGVNEEVIRRYVQNQSHHQTELTQRHLEF